MARTPKRTRARGRGRKKSLQTEFISTDNSSDSDVQNRATKHRKIKLSDSSDDDNASDSNTKSHVVQGVVDNLSSDEAVNIIKRPRKGSNRQVIDSDSSNNEEVAITPKKRKVQRPESDEEIL